MRASPRIVEYELTTLCNFRCIHCYSRAGNKTANELNFNEIKSLMIELREMNVGIFDLIGGEPLLHPRILDILSFGKELGQTLMVNTNGSLATEDMVRKVKKTNPDVLIGVSLDGPDPETNDFIRGRGNFKRAIMGIKNFVKYGFNVTILHVINKKNWWKLEDMIKLAKSLGVNGMYLDRFVPVGRGKLHIADLDIEDGKWSEVVKQILDIVEVYRNEINFYVEESISGGLCPAGITQASIRMDGIVVPCGHFRYNEELYMGNVRKKGFEQIWNSYDPSTLDLFLPKDYKGGCKALYLKDL
ncbi:MAG: radical SAM protein [Thermotogae bacterium]|nr:radical SAM protein [Thermotogota bacterium]